MVRAIKAQSILAEIEMERRQLRFRQIQDFPMLSSSPY
ncbi:hypothetical protein JOF28_001360 [Leucobacter exalbidus]|uniref:Uncharacterized protein n=1 Tax=Leucobacter exalbidus TaxID=662960 RepID=A0A940PSS7_9MICO|nr:hypothetical protein [Leucobacter exalbidus]